MASGNGHRDLVLVSTSVYRRELIGRLGIPFRFCAPRFDEETLKQGELGPRELAERLALLKAQSVEEEFPHATLIGCDQLVSFQGEILGKPGSENAAIRQLTRMESNTHDLITSMVVIHRGEIATHTDITTLRMRALTNLQIERYVRADRPFDCAGSYKLEQRGITLFEAIDSKDHSAITGLPLLALIRILGKLGYEIP